VVNEKKGLSQQRERGNKTRKISAFARPVENRLVQNVLRSVIAEPKTSQEWLKAGTKDHIWGEEGRCRPDRACRGKKKNKLKILGKGATEKSWG